MEMNPVTSQNAYEIPNLQKRDEAEASPPVELKKEKDNSVADAVGSMNGVTEALNHSVRFKIHEETGRIQINVVDTVKNQIVNQIPSDNILNMVAKLKDYVGLLFDEKR